MPTIAIRSRHERSALILYGSETGTAQDVAEEMGQLLQRLHFATRVCEMNAVDIDHLSQRTVVVIVVSTTGQGELPTNCQLFWKSLLRKRLTSTYLEDVGFTTFGLGDSSYPKYNWAARKLQKRLIQLGATEFYPRGEADNQHPEGVDGSFLPWSSGLRTHLLEAYGCPPGLTPIPDDELLRPKWLLDFLNDSTAPEAVPDSVDTDSGPNHEAEEKMLLNEAGDNPGPRHDHSDDESPSSELLPIPDSTTVTVDRNDRLTPTGHWQDVRWLALSGSELITYQPGDVLTVFPKNFSQEVRNMIELMGWTEVADKPIQFVPTDPLIGAHQDQPPIPYLLPPPRLTLRRLLTHHLDINSIPRRSFFSLIAHFTADPFQKDRLLEFTQPEYLDELYDYTTRPRRSILEVLQEFDTVKIPWRWAGAVFPALKGRQFSIASGGPLKTTDAKPERSRFDLLVAIVKYRTVIRRVRQGVCSRYLASLPEGSEIRVLLRRGGLNISRAEGTKPVVLVAPGTGVAPMRSLLWERLSWIREAKEQKESTLANGHCATASGGKNLLFFGCRNKEADYFYKDEWKQLKAEMDLEVHAAFSRDQRTKIYVQDLIREQAELVHRLLHEQLGLVYICGSSGKMPQAVREALIEVFQARGGLDRARAEAYLLKMEKEGRYKQETW